MVFSRNVIPVAFCLLLGATTASFATEQKVRVSASDKAACMPDAVRFCRDAIPNVHNVLVCFGKIRSKISGRCNAVLASYGL